MNSYQKLKEKVKQLEEENKKLSKSLYFVVNYPNSEHAIINIIEQKVIHSTESQLMQGCSHEDCTNDALRYYAPKQKI